MHQLSVDDSLRIFGEAKSRVPQRREIYGPFDFGDELSIGCCLKSVDPTQNKQFGIFAGSYDFQFVVVLHNVNGPCLGGEAFESIPEMYERWTVD